MRIVLAATGLRAIGWSMSLLFTMKVGKVRSVTKFEFVEGVDDSSKEAKADGSAWGTADPSNGGSGEFEADASFIFFAFAALTFKRTFFKASRNACATFSFAALLLIGYQRSFSRFYVCHFEF